MTDCPKCRNARTFQLRRFEQNGPVLIPIPFDVPCIYCCYRVLGSGTVVNARA